MTFDSEELLLLAGQGSRDAMGEFYRRHKPYVAAFFRHACPDVDRVHDLTQEVFLRLWKAASSYRPAGKLTAYLFAVALNVWRDHGRRLRSRPAEAGHSYLDSFPSDAPSPDRASQTGEFDSDLRRALASLPEPERIAFVLSEIHSISYKDIAGIMRCTVGAVGSRKSRAIAHLRRLLIRHAPESYLKEAANNEMP